MRLTPNYNAQKLNQYQYFPALYAPVCSPPLLQAEITFKDLLVLRVMNGR
jgi:hypothetical protein